MNKYVEIAGYFEKAFNGELPTAAFNGAIKAMKSKPELCERISCFDETLWSIIQDCLNGHIKPADEECFLHACALLETRLTSVNA